MRCRRSRDRNLLACQCRVINGFIISVSRIFYGADNRAIIFAGDEVRDLLAFERRNERLGLVGLFVTLFDRDDVAVSRGGTFCQQRVLNRIQLSVQRVVGVDNRIINVLKRVGKLRCLNFLTVPDEGQIAVNGETLFDAADPNTQKESEIRRKRLHFGLVFQNFNLFPQYTARQNVMLASELLAKEQPDYKARKKQIHAQIAAHAEELLTQVGLKEKMDLYPHQLSGGQQQRVAIARALALQPDILCFDEPTSALDPELTGEVLKVIRSLSEQHMTMIIVTHEMAFARDVANRVIFMDGGVIVEQGPARDVIENPQAERTKQFLARYRENQ